MKIKGLTLALALFLGFNGTSVFGVEESNLFKLDCSLSSKSTEANQLQQTKVL